MVDEKIPNLTFQEAVDYLNLLHAEHPGRSISEIIDMFEEDGNLVDFNAISTAYNTIRGQNLPQGETPSEVFYEEPKQEPEPLPSLVRPLTLHPSTQAEKHKNLMAHYHNLLTLYAIIHLVEQNARLHNAPMSDQELRDINELAQAVSERDSQKESEKATRAATQRAQKAGKPVPNPKQKHISGSKSLREVFKNSYLFHGQQVIDATLQQEEDQDAAHYEFYRLERNIIDTENENNAIQLRKMTSMVKNIMATLKQRYK